MRSRFDGWFVFQWTCWSAIVFLSSYAVLYVFVGLVKSSWFLKASNVAEVFPGGLLSNRLLLLAHVLTACPCLLLGPLLFLPGLRNRCINLHRWMGRCYIIGVLSSAVLGFLLARFNRHGVVAQFGFMSLAVCWFSTTTIGYWRIRYSADWISHRRWMIRSYALSLAVVTVRFLDAPAGMTKEEWFPIMTWVCWVPNLLVGELYARCTNERGRLILFPRKRLARPGGALNPSALPAEAGGVSTQQS